MTLAKKWFFLVLNSNQSNVDLLSLLISLPKKHKYLVFVCYYGCFTLEQCQAAMLLSNHYQSLFASKSFNLVLSRRNFSNVIKKEQNRHVTKW